MNALKTQIQMLKDRETETQNKNLELNQLLVSLETRFLNLSGNTQSQVNIGATCFVSEFNVFIWQL